VWRRHLCGVAGAVFFGGQSVVGCARWENELLRPGKVALPVGPALMYNPFYGKVNKDYTQKTRPACHGERPANRDQDAARLDPFDRWLGRPQHGGLSLRGRPPARRAWARGLAADEEAQPKSRGESVRNGRPTNRQTRQSVIARGRTASAETPAHQRAAGISGHSRRSAEAKDLIGRWRCTNSSSVKSYFCNPTIGNRGAAFGAYAANKQLPERGDEFEYQIKSSSEPHERVVRESELRGA
jgi:hypothetical protein